nr:MAG TPA: hypothetical protein [Caudoviricetes sp.]
MSNIALSSVSSYHDTTVSFAIFIIVLKGKILGYSSRSCWLIQ